MNSERVPVAIVGGGPTGMVAAALLAGQGVPCTIIERHAQPYPLPRAVHIDDEIRRVLQQIGIEADFAGMSRPLPGMRLLDAQHRVFGEILRGTEPGHHGHFPDSMFDQPELESLLRKALDDLPEVTWRTGTEVTAVSQAADGPVQLSMLDGQGRQHALEAEFVLGCDGANSMAREYVGARLRDLHFEERWLVIDVEAHSPLNTWEGLEQVCDPDRAGTFMQVVGLRYRFEFQMREGETVDSLTARLDDLLMPWTQGIGYDLVRSAEYTFRARVTDRWRKGRVFLLGDAAHTTPPFIGQGLCSGVRDAVNLSWKVAWLLSGRADATILDTYATEREPNATHVVRMAVLIGNAMTGGQARVARLRQVLAGRLLAYEPINRRIAANVAPPLRRGPLVGRTKRAGHHIPQPAVRVDGRTALLDDLLGTGFALVLTGPLRSADMQVAAATGARIVRVHPGDMPTPAALPEVLDVVDTSHQLLDWMRPARSLLVRPDRIVLCSDPDPSDLPNLLLPA